MKLKLQIELIHPDNFGENLRKYLAVETWDKVRKRIYDEANYSCSICKATGVQLHCHEVWIYDDKKKIQKLLGLQCLCAKCHDVKHWGRTTSMNHLGKLPSSYLKELIEHFCITNSCTEDTFRKHSAGAFYTHSKRAKYKYKIDWGTMKPAKLEDLFATSRKKGEARFIK